MFNLPMKKHDVVIYGATSFVGKLVVEHFAKTYGVGQGLSWAIAGRSHDKLDAVRRAQGQGADAIPILIADAQDLPALKAMCAQAKVVISMAGPFAIHGAKLVQACAETGTDYCDITGEPIWVAEMMQRHEKTAKATGARIISFCGFDSIPSDMGVHLVQQEAMRRFGKPCAQVRMRVMHARGNPPGGTYATAMDAIGKASSDSAYRKAMFDPYLICPQGHGFTAKQSNAFLPAFDPTIKRWTAHFVMGNINTRVVHRSNALKGKAYGAAFRYDEAIVVGPGLLGWVGAQVVSGLMFGFVVLAALPITRQLLARFVLPKPGEGSNLAKLAKCDFEVRLIGETGGREQVQVALRGDGDPACYATSRMIAEAGACLAMDVDKQAAPGGFGTPASVLGDKLIERLRRNGKMQFSVLPSA
jgi:short subunit dehydrogenase-like uncharacterized protein